MSTCARGPSWAGGSYPTSIGWWRGRGGRTERVPISAAARDPLDRPVGFKISSSGGEVLMRDGQLVCRPYRPRHELTVFAINENGGVAEETISLGG